MYVPFVWQVKWDRALREEALKASQTQLTKTYTPVAIRDNQQYSQSANQQYSQSADHLCGKTIR